MLIVTEHLLKVANNLEKRVYKIDIQIENINKVIYNLELIYARNVSDDNSTKDTVRSDLLRCRERLYDMRKKFVELAEVIYISLNYYVKWDEKNASYCYEDALIYKERSRGVMDLTGIKSVIEGAIKN